MPNNGRNARQIKRIRNEVLVTLRMPYPAALRAQHIFQSLLTLFPTLEFEHFKRDLHYLNAKGYLERVIPDGDRTSDLTPWRQRWFRLTTTGLELAERCISDPALEES